MNLDNITENQSFLIFRIQGCLYAFDAASIEKIVYLPEFKAFAEATPPVVGFLNYHSAIISVFDVNLFLGLPLKTVKAQDYLVILKAENLRFGVIVSEIVDIKPLAMEKKQEIQEKKPFSLFYGLYKNEIVCVLDIATFCEKVEHFSSGDQVAEASLQKVQEFVNLTIVEIRKEFYGIDPKIIQEYCLLLELTPLPAAPPHILGFINLRGTILPVMDIWGVMGLQPLEIKESSKVLVIPMMNILIGVVVDEVLDVVSLPFENFKANPVKSGTEQYVKYTVRYKNGVLGILDIKKIVEFLLQSRM